MASVFRILWLYIVIHVCVCARYICFHPDSEWQNVLCPQTWMPITEEGCWIWWREERGSSSATSKTTWRTPWKTRPLRSWVRSPRKSPTTHGTRWSVQQQHGLLFCFRHTCYYIVTVVNGPRNMFQMGQAVGDFFGLCEREMYSVTELLCNLAQQMER